MVELSDELRPRRPNFRSWRFWLLPTICGLTASLFLLAMVLPWRDQVDQGAWWMFVTPAGFGFAAVAFVAFRTFRATERLFLWITALAVVIAIATLTTRGGLRMTGSKTFAVTDWQLIRIYGTEAFFVLAPGFAWKLFVSKATRNATVGLMVAFVASVFILSLAAIPGLVEEVLFFAMAPVGGLAAIVAWLAFWTIAAFTDWRSAIGPVLVAIAFVSLQTAIFYATNAFGFAFAIEAVLVGVINLWWRHNYGKTGD